MVREKDRPGIDGYQIRPLVMESAKEYQEWSKCLPATVDLPTTHEHHISHAAMPDGRMIIEITVRRKSGETPVIEPDGLNGLDDAGLELAAAKAGMDIPAFRKHTSKSRKVKAIRDHAVVGAAT